VGGKRATEDAENRQTYSKRKTVWGVGHHTAHGSCQNAGGLIQGWLVGVEISAALAMDGIVVRN